MKELRTLVAAICLAATLSLYGQNDFKPGYIIGPDQDTIYGQIKTQSESRNARSCIFRTGEDGEESRYEPGEIIAYRIVGGKYYVSKTLKEEGVEKQVFMEYLVNGMADLYYLREENSETFYIQKEGEDALAITDIRLLKAAFSDSYEIQSSLDKATLSQKSLVDMTVKYHDYVCDGEVCINYSKEASRLSIQAGPVAGYSVSPVRLTGTELFEAFDFGKSQVPVFGVLLDLGADRLGQHISFQLGVEYSKHSLQAYTEIPGSQYYIDRHTYDVQFQSSLLSFQLGTSYAFRGNRVRPFVGGGLLFSKFVGTDFHYTEDTYYLNWEPGIVSNTWNGNPVASLLYGGYVQAGLEVKLSQRLMLVSALKAGYLTSNPNTIIALKAQQNDQMRITPEMIPVSVHIGILF